MLTTFSGILFGFLLNMAINVPYNFAFIDKITLIAALYSITVAASLFVMPVVYHHLQYPYGSFHKFKTRSHRFIIVGLIPAGITLFLGLELAIHSLLGGLGLAVDYLWGSIDSFILAATLYPCLFFVQSQKKRNLIESIGSTYSILI